MTTDKVMFTQAYTQWAENAPVCVLSIKCIFKNMHKSSAVGKNRSLDVQLHIDERNDSESFAGNFASLAAGGAVGGGEWGAVWGVGGVLQPL